MVLEKRSRRLVKEYALVFAATLILYLISCAPSYVWQDSGMIQYRVLCNDIRGGLGLALAHPLYYIISIAFKNIPFGGTIYKINIVSPICASFAIANLYLLMRRWLGQVFPAVVTAATLALSHTFWRHASIPETYNLYLAFLFAELNFLLSYLRTSEKKYLALLGLVNGLGISVHMFGVIPLAVYGLFVLGLLFIKRIKFPVLILFIAFWMIGACVYEYLIIEHLIATGDVVATIKSSLFGSGWEKDVMNASLNAKIVKENILYIGLNFPTLNALLAIVGLVSVFKLKDIGQLRWFILSLLALFFVFAFRYTVPDRYAFFLPFYAMLSILIGLGVYSISKAKLNIAFSTVVCLFALMPAVLYFFLPVLVEKHYPIFKNKRQLPYRNEYVYFLQPWRTGYLGAEQFAAEAFGLVEENAVIFPDGTSLYPLAIAQKLVGVRGDVLVLSSHGSYDNLSSMSDAEIQELISSRPVYVVGSDRSYHPAFLHDREIEKYGVLYKVK